MTADMRGGAHRPTVRRYAMTGMWIVYCGGCQAVGFPVPPVLARCLTWKQALTAANGHARRQETP